MTDSAPYRDAVARDGASHQQWPASMEEMNMPPFVGYLSTATITLGENGVLAVGFAKPPLRGHVLQLTPYVAEGALHWSCAGDVPAKLLPLECRDQTQR
jgi:hypothetical protein